jgi:Flp pilus assembly protein TadG
MSSSIQNLWLKHQSEPEEGQSLVEFALVFAFIIVPLTLVIIETGTLLYQYVALTNAAREGVRAGSVYLYVGDPGGSTAAPDAGRSAAVADTIRSAIGPLVVSPPDCNGTTATTTCQIVYGPSSVPVPIPDPLRSTDAMTVTLTHNHRILFGVLGGDINLQAQASMRIEPSAVISDTGP